MTIFARPLTRLRAGAVPHKLSLALVLALAASLLPAAPASAIVEEVGTVHVGLQPRTQVLEEGLPETFKDEDGNAVLDGTSVYAIFWDPRDVFHEHHEWLTKISTFFQQMGAASGDDASALGELDQYRDREGGSAAYSTVFKGAYSDLTEYPTGGCKDPEPLEYGAITCLTDQQLREQLETFIAHNDLPTGMKSIFYVLTPPGVTVCLDATATHCSDFKVSGAEETSEEPASVSYQDSFCSYHGDINPDNAPEGDGNTIIYAAIPWSAGTLGASPQHAHGQYARHYLYAKGVYCQDGGWNPEKHEENFEIPKKLGTAEEELLEGKTGTPQEAEALETRIRLESPHQQEPNQESASEGKGEEGDWGAGLADLIDNQIAIEQANTVTDPLLDGWQDSTGREVSDLCRDVFGNTVGEQGGAIVGSVTAQTKTEAGTLANQPLGGGSYYLQNLFNLGSGRCGAGVTLIPRFTAPDPVNSGEAVSFDGLESTVGLLKGTVFSGSGEETSTYAKFTWNFGDGTTATGYAPDSPPCESPWLTPCAGSIYHSYQYGGNYTVTLTITDVAGNSASVTHTVTVAGPAAPAPPASTAAPAPSSGAPSSVTVAAPVAAAQILSRSLPSTLKKGLLVSYSVNEQVAGHFEVLISRSLARRLKLGGAPATGLPAGTPPQLVIAKAILITTKGGHSTIAIRFSKAVAARLSHTRRAPLMLRLIVRNAASKSPATTTVLSSVTLTG